MSAGLASVTQSYAQQTFVIVPDNPNAGGGSNAVASSNVNVRRGPGTNYAVVDVLLRGTNVHINNCNNAGWCWVNHGGPSGWVSENFLQRVSGGGGGGGGGGVVQPPPSAARQACFYDRTHLRGRSFCARPGASDASLSPTWNNRISSIRIRGFTTVQVCEGRNFHRCEAYNRDVTILPWWLDGNISSYRVFH